MVVPAIGFDFPWWYPLPLLGVLAALAAAVALALNMPDDPVAAARRKRVIRALLGLAVLAPVLVGAILAAVR